MPSREFAPLDHISDLTAEEYYDLLHPNGSRGRAAVMIKSCGDCVEGHSLDRHKLLMQMPFFVDRTSFLTLNRFWTG